MDTQILKDDNETSFNNLNDTQRLIDASKYILGCPVLLRDKSNNTYHGIFAKISSNYDIVLDCCHKIDPDNETIIFGRSLPSKSKVDLKYFERETIVEMTAYDVDIDFASKTAENIFIDSSIAKKLTLEKRRNICSLNSDDDELKELEPFCFDDEAQLSPKLKSLELEDEFGWNVEDMLMINQQKYGYKSTFNSEMTEYTLPVEKEDSDDFKRRERMAEKLALEIESSSSYRKNIDKELSDNEEEEDVFSAVIRSSGEISTNSNNNNNNNKSSKRRSFGKQHRNGNNCGYYSGAKNGKNKNHQSNNSSKRFSNYLQTV